MLATETKKKKPSHSFKHTKCVIKLQVSSPDVAHGVCVVFFGGPDDREALELAGRMAEHPGVDVTAMRFVTGDNGGEDGRQAVKLKPAPSKNEEKSYTFSTADVDIEREKVCSVTSQHSRNIVDSSCFFSFLT